MLNSFLKYQGIHPGAIIERELKRQGLKKSEFSRIVDEYPQVINEIIKQRRGIPTLLALKMEKALGMEEGTLVMLQSFYEIKKAKEKLPGTTPNMSLLRPALFWDTDIEQLDWEKNAIAVIERVFTRGNEIEKKEIMRFYGEEKVRNVVYGEKENLL